jgi:hypothetical protein
MGRIADYVATLSPAERERFRDLIEECSEREASIQSNAARADAALVQLARQHDVLAAKIRDLEHAGQRLLERVSRIYMKTVPTPSTMH